MSQFSSATSIPKRYHLGTPCGKWCLGSCEPVCGGVEYLLKLVDEAGGMEPVRGSVMDLQGERERHLPRLLDVLTESEDRQVMVVSMGNVQAESTERQPGQT